MKYLPLSHRRMRRMKMRKVMVGYGGGG